MTYLHTPETTRADRRSKIVDRLRLARRYVTSYYNSHRHRAWFADVKTYCMFIGHARSGHSIVGALLDAHPNVILADEVDVLQYVAAGFSREQIYHLLLVRSRRQANKGRTKGGREGKTYSYLVPGQWQGRFDHLQVVGDSKAGTSTQRLAEDISLLPRLRKVMKDVEVKIIHVTRNPYDNISTLIMRGGRSFENAIERYFANCATIVDIRRHVDSANLLLVRQEDLITQPDLCLTEACRFVGLEPTEDYLRACSSILYRTPAKSRDKVEWTAERIATVQRNIDSFDFLASYSYED